MCLRLISFSYMLTNLLLSSPPLASTAPLPLLLFDVDRLAGLLLLLFVIVLDGAGWRDTPRRGRAGLLLSVHTAVDITKGPLIQTSIKNKNYNKYVFDVTQIIPPDNTVSCKKITI